MATWNVRGFAFKWGKCPLRRSRCRTFLYDKTFGALVPPGESAGTRRLRATSFGAAWASSPTHLRATASRRERPVPRPSPSALGRGTRRWGTRAEEGRKHLWVFPSKVGFSPVALGYARFGVLVSLDPGGPGKWPWRRGCDGAGALGWDPDPRPCVRLSSRPCHFSVRAGGEGSTGCRLSACARGAAVGRWRAGVAQRGRSQPCSGLRSDPGPRSPARARVGTQETSRGPAAQFKRLKKETCDRASVPPR